MEASNSILDWVFLIFVGSNQASGVLDIFILIGLGWLFYTTWKLIQYPLRSYSRRRSSHRVEKIPESRGNLNFPYKPLDRQRREIRLLQILPKSSSPDIKCILVHVTLDDPTITYAALSYAWVGKNLYAALRALQLPEIARNVWIDAICIDQTNLSERSEQVGFMRDIYKNAPNSVVIWLETDSTTSEDAYKFIEEAQRHESPEDWMRSTTGAENYKKPWVAIGQLLNNAYWSRMWIIQEVVCAPIINILCGPFSMDWRVLVAANNCWKDNRLLKPDMSEWFIEEAVQNRTTGLGAIRHIFGALVFLPSPKDVNAISFREIPVGPKFLETTRAAHIGADAQRSLFDLMCLYESSQATDSRDKIYASWALGPTRKMTIMRQIIKSHNMPLPLTLLTS